MFLFSDIIRQKWIIDDVTRDPLTLPDDPNNPPQLERTNLIKSEALSKVPSDHYRPAYRNFIKYCPKWLQISMNPKKRVWSYIRKEQSSPFDTRNHLPRHMKELEIAVDEGHERIFIEPRCLAMYIDEFIRFGEHCHYYAYVWGVWSMWFNWRHPTLWWIYAPMSFCAVCNSYAFTRLWMRDRLCRYDLFDAENYDIEDGLDFMSIQKCCPKNWWVLRRITRLKFLAGLLRHQAMSVLSCFVTVWRLGRMEDWFLGPVHRQVSIDGPINTCDYFLPDILDLDKKFAPELPMDVPFWSIGFNIGTTADGWLILAVLALYLTEGIHAYYAKAKAKEEKDLEDGITPENSGVITPVNSPPLSPSRELGKTNLHDDDSDDYYENREIHWL